MPLPSAIRRASGEHALRPSRKPVRVTTASAAATGSKRLGVASAGAWTAVAAGATTAGSASGGAASGSPPSRPVAPADSPGAASASGTVAAPGAMAVAGCAATVISARGSPTDTVSPSAAITRAITPSAGARISVSTLSVAMSHTGSSARTASPTALCQAITVPSVTDTPMWGIGIVISVSLTKSSQALTSISTLMSPPVPAACRASSSGVCARSITRVMSRSGSSCPAAIIVAARGRS